MNSSVRAQAVIDTTGPVVTRSALRRAGVDGKWIKRRLGEGRWRELLPGTFLVGPAPSEEVAFLWAALAFAGADAVLCRQTALRAWLGPHIARTAVVHVAVPHGRTRRHSPHVAVHQRAGCDVFHHDGFPITGLPETLVDLAGHIGANDFRCYAAEAVHAGLMLPGALRAESHIEPCAMRIVREVSEELNAGAISGGECAFWRIVAESGLPLPELNIPASTSGGLFVVDAFWRVLRLAVEVDGRSVHAKQDAFEADLDRQNWLQIDGILIIRFPVSMVFGRPDRVRAILEQALRARAAELDIPWSEVVRASRAVPSFLS